MARSYLKYPLLLAAASMLTACVVAPAAPVQVVGSEPVYGPWTYQSPPPPRLEYRGVAPGPTYVWIDGYWNWGGARFQWVPGYWVAPPPGRVWVAPVWRRDGERWRSEGGRWEQHAVPPAWVHREPVPSLPPPRPLPPEIRPAPYWEPHREPRPDWHREPRFEQPVAPAPGVLREPGRPLPAPWGAVPGGRSAGVAREPDEGRRGPYWRREGPPDGDRDRDRDRDRDQDRR